MYSKNKYGKWNGIEIGANIGIYWYIGFKFSFREQSINDKLTPKSSTNPKF